MAAGGVYLPWATGFTSDPLHDTLTCHFVTVTVILHGRETCSRTTTVPTKMTGADLKGHLAVNGVVTTCSGLEIALEEGGELVGDDIPLELREGQILHLRWGREMVSVTALVTG